MSRDLLFAVALLADVAWGATTVILMRHCVRSTDNAIAYFYPSPWLGMPSFNDYSSQPWPHFGTKEAFDCTPRGLEFVEAAGRWFRDEGTLPMPITGVADDNERNNASGRSFFAGLGVPINNASFVVDGNPFSISERCPRIPDIDAVVSASQRLHPLPPGELERSIAAVLNVTGVGAAGDWWDAPCFEPSAAVGLNGSWPPGAWGTSSGDGSHGAPVFWSSFPVLGSCNVYASFLERFLMEWGAGLTPGWGRLDPAVDIPRLMRVHDWWYSIVCEALAPQFGAGLVRSMLDSLDGVAGTKVFFGHDSDLLALGANLGISWEAEPWPANTTIPGAALRLDLDVGSGSVQAGFSYAASFDEVGGGFRSSTALFEPRGAAEVALAELQRRAAERTISECSTVQAVWPRDPLVVVFT